MVMRNQQTAVLHGHVVFPGVCVYFYILEDNQFGIKTSFEYANCSGQDVCIVEIRIRFLMIVSSPFITNNVVATGL